MSTHDPKSMSALGFLTVVEDPEHGLFGGYLVLNPAGRPLEFHCTAPIKPNRAQEILYGPPLEPYLFGEQIGKGLVAKSRIEPIVLCTDREPTLAVSQYVGPTVVLVLPDDEPDHDATGQGEKLFRLDAAHRGGLKHIRLGRNRLAVPEEAVNERGELDGRIVELVQAFDLSEPFARIRQAIEEARRAA